jgi:hypothetical protein
MMYQFLNISDSTSLEMNISRLLKYRTLHEIYLFPLKTMDNSSDPISEEGLSPLEPGIPSLQGTAKKLSPETSNRAQIKQAKQLKAIVTIHCFYF